MRVPTLDEPLLARDAVELGTAPVRPVHGIGVIRVAPRLSRRAVLGGCGRGNCQECRSDETGQDGQRTQEQIRLHRRCSLGWKSWRDIATKALGPSDCREWGELEEAFGEKSRVTQSSRLSHHRPRFALTAWPIARIVNAASTDK